MNLKMIGEICNLLEECKIVGISKNVGTQFYAEYQKINGVLYRIEEPENIQQKGIDFNNVVSYKVIEEPKYKVGDWVVVEWEDVGIKVEKIENITGELNTVAEFKILPLSPKSYKARTYLKNIKRKATLEDLEKAVYDLFKSNRELIYKNVVVILDKDVIRLKNCNDEIFNELRFSSIYCNFLENANPYREKGSVEFEEIDVDFNYNPTNVYETLKTLIKNQNKIIEILKEKE